jgi:hypothetical protein
VRRLSARGVEPRAARRDRGKFERFVAHESRHDLLLLLLLFLLFFGQHLAESVKESSDRDGVEADTDDDKETAQDLAWQREVNLTPLATEENGTANAPSSVPSSTAVQDKFLGKSENIYRERKRGYICIYIRGMKQSGRKRMPARDER